MPALKPTDHFAEITWLGCVMTDDREELWAEPRDTFDLTFAGIAGAFHSGETRASCSRVTSQYAKGTPIRNERQLSIVSAEELEAIAAAMGVDSVDPARLGASMVVRGIADFTHVPPSSRLQAPSGATLTIDMENRPCHWPGKSLDKAEPGTGKSFKRAAEDKRGVTAWVAAEGRLAVGDTLRLHVPDQRAWAP
ncbi:MOSC domain-containing protein [Pseudaestuariivita sp.]|uniref:MOSC domain-containing protein n=1 Tax=Pseudaestuariivita sp. TaxID=2211669 RepID=UPI004059764F